MTGAADPDPLAQSTDTRRRDLEDYVDILEIHPDYEQGRCRIEGCDTLRWVHQDSLEAGSPGVLCKAHAPDIRHLYPDVEVRI